MKYSFNCTLKIGDVIVVKEKFARVNPGTYRTDMVSTSTTDGVFTTKNIQYFFADLNSNGSDWDADEDELLVAIRQGKVLVKSDIKLTKYKVKFVNISENKFEETIIYTLPNTEVSLDYFAKRVCGGFHFDHEYGRDSAILVANEIGISSYEKVG